MLFWIAEKICLIYLLFLKWQIFSDHCCPNLNLHGIFTGADKRFNLQVLLERLKKQLNLPSILVNPANRTGRKVHMIGQQYNLTLVIVIPNHNPTLRMRISPRCRNLPKAVDKPPSISRSESAPANWPKTIATN
jgi:hypothetical protein